jgi:hypothetical protein
MSTHNVDIEKAQPIVVEKAAPLQEQAPTIVTTPAAKHKRRLIVATIAIMFIALAIGLGVGLSKSSKNAAPAVTQSSLELLCKDDMKACKLACQDYMCCFDETPAADCAIPANSCGHYAPCYALLRQESDEEEQTVNQGGGGASLPGGNTGDISQGLKEPTIEVHDICNSGYMEVSDITCEEACSPANCCYWTGDESCYEDNAEVCDLWKDSGCFAFSDPWLAGGEGGGATLPGGTVLKEGETLEEPDAQVEIICNSGYNEVGDITCEEACNPAACCYWTGEDSCYADNEAVCEIWREAGCFVFSVQHEQEVP